MILNTEKAKNTELEKNNFSDEQLKSFNDIPSLAPIYKVVRKTEEFVNDSDVYASKYFGNPYITSTKEIPKDSSGRYQIMIAQFNCKDFININELGGLSFIKGMNLDFQDDFGIKEAKEYFEKATKANFIKLPEAGLLQFWVCVGANEFAEGIGGKKTCRVVYVEDYSTEPNQLAIAKYFKQISQSVEDVENEYFGANPLVLSTDSRCIYLDFVLSIDIYTGCPELERDCYSQDWEILPEEQEIKTFFDKYSDGSSPYKWFSAEYIGYYMMGLCGEITEAKSKLICNYPAHHSKYSTIGGYGKTSQNYCIDDYVTLLKLDCDDFWEYHDDGEVNFVINYKDLGKEKWGKATIEQAFL